MQTRYLLWVDGVGAFLVCLSERVTMGSVVSARLPQPDIALLANLSRRHATVVRRGDAYLLEAHSPTKVAGRNILDHADLSDGSEIELSGSVRLTFRLPTALSTSARLEFVSDHRPAHAIDGVVLMDDTCLLGPGPESHVCCADWPGTVLLFRKAGRLWCKSRLEIFCEGQPISAGAPLDDGDIITGADLRFRIEAVQ